MKSNNHPPSSQATLQQEFTNLFPPIIIYLGSIIIYLCILKDLARVGLNPEWILIRLSYLPFIAAIWYFSKRHLQQTPFYEFPLWMAALYITFLCTYFSLTTGGLKSDYAFGLIQFYFVISVMPLTKKTFYGVSLASIAIYIGINILNAGTSILHDQIIITAMLPIIIFAPIIYIITSKIRAAKISLQNSLAETLRDRDEVIKTQSGILAKAETKAAVGLMVAQVAHDIRSPVAVLNMVSSGQVAFNEGLRATIQEAVGRINDIASNLLNKFKSKSDGQLSELTISRLHDHIAEIIHEKKFQYMATEVKFVLDLNEAGRDGLIKVPLSDLMRVISNLINNAVEACGQGGVIGVSAVVQSDKWLMEITDNGCGIPAEWMEKIFTQGQTTKPDGLGLGLYHARSVLQSVGGEIKLCSKMAFGTTVSIELPL